MFFFFAHTDLSGSVLPNFNSSFVLVHQIRLQETFYALWLAQLVRDLVIY